MYLPPLPQERERPLLLPLDLLLLLPLLLLRLLLLLLPLLLRLLDLDLDLWESPHFLSPLLSLALEWDWDLRLPSVPSLSRMCLSLLLFCGAASSLTWP